MLFKKGEGLLAAVLQRPTSPAQGQSMDLQKTWRKLSQGCRMVIKTRKLVLAAWKNYRSRHLRIGDLEEVQEIFQDLTFAVTAWPISAKRVGNPMWYHKPCCHIGNLSSAVRCTCVRPEQTMAVNYTGHQVICKRASWDSTSAAEEIYCSFNQTLQFKHI